jgi:hypothetical protein
VQVIGAVSCERFGELRGEAGVLQTIGAPEHDRVCLGALSDADAAVLTSRRAGDAR